MEDAKKFFFSPAVSHSIIYICNEEKTQWRSANKEGSQQQQVFKGFTNQNPRNIFKTLDLLSLDRQNNLYKYDSKKKHVYELKLAIISLGRLYALLPLLALC